MQPSTDARRPHAQIKLPAGLRVSALERLAGWLAALLVIVGFAATVLILLWLAGRAIAAREPPPVELFVEDSIAGTPMTGTEREFVEPGVEEFAEVERPQLADTLAAITTAVTSQQAALDEMYGADDRVGRGAGQGGRQSTGPGGEGSLDVVPRNQRWRIQYTTGSLRAYARQLDFFQIELAAFGGGREGVVYASKFAAGNPQTRELGQDEVEQRRRFTHQSGALQEFDRQLLAAAGVDAGGRIVAQFMPAKVENRLAQLEREKAKGRDLEEIQRTVFGVQSVGDGYQLIVVRQEYRPRP